jgi:integrase
MDVLVERWLDHLESVGDLKPRTIEDHRWRWSTYLQKHIGKFKANDIERGQLALALDKIRKLTKEQARKCLTTVSLALDYGLTCQIVSENPARLLRPKDFGATPNTPRDRWLSVDELRQFWGYLENTKHSISFPMVSALKLLLYTGARRSEVIEAKWSEFDLEKGLWVLPAERSKNKQSHTFYLSDGARKIMSALDEFSGHAEFVFESPSLKGKPITPRAVTRSISRVCDALDCNPFTVHDLRRTCASHWVDRWGPIVAWLS